MNLRKCSQFFLAIVFCVLLASAGYAQPYSEIFVFGHSLSDTGNFKQLFLPLGVEWPPSPPYHGGRWSNGPVFVEVLADNFGLGEVVASENGGNNYAVTGAWAKGDFYFFGILIPGLRHQVEYHLDRVGGAVDPAALYVVNIGENDLDVAQGVWAEQGWDAALIVVEEAVEGTLDAIRMLADHGAVHFVVTSTLSLNGINPGACDSVYGDDLSDAFNSLLGEGLAEIEDDLSIAYGGGGLLKQMSEHFVICVSCVQLLDPFPVCDNPDEVFFWDDQGHPPAPVHQLLGDAITALVLRNRVGELMVEGTLSPGEANSLQAKLDGAYGKLGDRKPKTAVNKIQAFANQVNAFVQTGRLTPEQAELLLVGAHGIVDQP